MCTHMQKGHMHVQVSVVHIRVCMHMLKPLWAMAEFASILCLLMPLCSMSEFASVLCVLNPLWSMAECVMRVKASAVMSEFGALTPSLP